MIKDANNTFADGVATGNIGTNLVGDVMDLEQVRDIGAGKPVYLTVHAVEDITAGAGGTYQVVLTSADDAALTTNPVNHLTSAELDAAATIAAGTAILKVALPMEDPEYKQYVGIREIVGTANTTAGSIDAFLTLDARSYKAYPQGKRFV